MTLEEAVRRCEFWTTLGSSALGSTRDPDVGMFFAADSIAAEQFSEPNGARIWAIRIPRQTKDGPFLIDNLAFHLIEQEIEKRAQPRTEGS